MSIIGNPIFLGGSGSGGGLNINQPLIHVVAPKGATVTFSSGGVVAKTISPSEAFFYSGGGVANYYYSATTGTWTVAATNGTVSTSDTIQVTENREYDLKLLYGYWLHRVDEGLLDGATVLWSTKSTNPNNPVDATTHISNKNEISTSQTGAFVCVVINKSLSLGNYSTCHFEYIKELEGNMASTYSAAKTGRFGFGTNTTTGAHSSDQKLISGLTICPDPTSVWTSASIDISASTATGYFKFIDWNNGRMGIRNLYLV